MRENDKEHTYIYCGSCNIIFVCGFYYAWFSNFLLIVVLCLPVLSLLCSLPFMIYSAVKGFSLYASKVIYAGDDVVINLAANNRNGLFCPLIKVLVYSKNSFCGKSKKQRLNTAE